MANRERSTWLALLFTSGVGLSAFDAYNARFHQELVRKHIEEHFLTAPADREPLRNAAIEELASEDSLRIVRAMAYLMVVGEAPDVQAVSRLLTHPVESIRKAAKTCCFELARR